MSYHSKSLRSYSRQPLSGLHASGNTRRFSRAALSGLHASGNTRRFSRAALGDTNDYNSPNADGTFASCPGDQEWQAFYGSCVNPCPSGQAYNASGVCAGGATTGTKPATSGGPSLASQIVSGLFGSANPTTVYPPGYIPPQTSILQSPMFLPLLIGGGILAYMIIKK